MSSNLIRVYEGAGLAEEYVKYRPGYPPFILETILKYIEREKAGNGKSGFMIDVGCGSGQATHMFTDYFDKILGIDISSSQIEVANRSSHSRNVSFQVVHDNLFPTANSSCDLVNCATAAHWLDLEVFERECNRVLKPGGAVAIYTYLLLGIKSLQSIDVCHEDFRSKFFEAILKFIDGCKGHERSKLKGYQEIFEEIKNPSKKWVEFPNIDKEYTLLEFKSFMATVGEYPKYMATNPKYDPMDDLSVALKKLLKEDSSKDEDVKFMVTIGHQLILFKN